MIETKGREVKVWEHKKFRKSLLELQRRGGSHGRAAQRVFALLGQLQSDPGALASLPTTNHGENRIRKVVKYDLSGFCRLITIQDSGYVFFCHAGDHDDCDRWLDKHRGMQVKAELDGKPLVIFESADVTDPQQRLERGRGMVHRPLLDLLPSDVRERLLRDTPKLVIREASCFDSAVLDQDILDVVESVSDAHQASALFDVLLLLRDEDAEGALRRVRLYLGELRDVETLVAAETPLVDSEDFKRVTLDQEQYKRMIEHYARTEDYRDWMLFMHPEQQKLVDADFAGPAKLSGVSGSGKTCVLVNRAISLASRYPGERILVLTLNRSLAVLINSLVDKSAPVDVRPSIEVLPYFRLCQRLLAVFEPQNGRLYDDVTWKSKEHIDEVWREFYRCELNNDSAKVLRRLHDSLIARGIDAETYLREELDWVRSATLPGTRERYLTIERRGRAYPLDTEFRREVLEGLAHWEAKICAVGITDYLGIASAAARYMDKIEPEYRCVLLDESQDFGTLELSVLRKLVAPDANDLFLCGDAAQQVSTKHQSLSEAGMPISGPRSTNLLLNYRNSREVLEIAHEVLVGSLAEEMLDSKDFDVLDPKYANFSGPAPLLLSAGSVAEQVYWAVRYARGESQASPGWKACIAICGYSRYELAPLAQYLDIPLLDGGVGMDEGPLFLSDLDDTKGFEFQCMIIINCTDGVIPNPRSPEKEQYRDLSRLYVAMTRAQSQLVIGFAAAPSAFIAPKRDSFLEETWSAYVGSGDEQVLIDPRHTPPKLDELRRDSIGEIEPDEMSAAQFLYTEQAIGLPLSIIDRLRATVNGKSRMVSRAPVEWKSIGALLRDLRGTGVSLLKVRNSFGPEAAKGLLAHMDRHASTSQSSRPGIDSVNHGI